jgi:antitoxin FitA
MVAKSMGVLVQIRDVPEPVHRVLKARAAASGMSFSEYLRALLARTAERPTPEELAARIRARGTAVRDEPSERSVRRLRDHGE